VIYKIFLFFAFIFAGLCLGYCFQRLHHKVPTLAKVDITALRRKIQRNVLLFAIPTIGMGSIWNLDLEREGIAILPLLGILQTLSGGGLALVIAQIMNLGRRQKGTLFCNGFFTNLGSLGGLTVFIFLGEEYYALVLIYKLFIEVMFYGVGFPIAKSFSPQISRDSSSFLDGIKKVLSDLFIIAAVIAMSAGLCLNLLNIPRPGFYSTLNAILIPTSALCMLFSIGLGLKVNKISQYKREAMVVMAIKFVLSPVIILGAAWLMGLDFKENLDLLRVIIILSVMPPAYTATVAPSLYDLDLDMSNSCWILSTMAMVIVIPALSVLLSLLK